MCGAVRLRYCAGMVEVRSWYAHGSLDSSIGESVQYSTVRSSVRLAVRAWRMHGMHGQYCVHRCKNANNTGLNAFLVQLCLDRR